MISGKSKESMSLCRNLKFSFPIKTNISFAPSFVSNYFLSLELSLSSLLPYKHLNPVITNVEKMNFLNW